MGEVHTPLSSSSQDCMDSSLVLFLQHLLALLLISLGSTTLTQPMELSHLFEGQQPYWDLLLQGSSWIISQIILFLSHFPRCFSDLLLLSTSLPGASPSMAEIDSLSIKNFE